MLPILDVVGGGGVLCLNRKATVAHSRHARLFIQLVGLLGRTEKFSRRDVDGVLDVCGAVPARRLNHTDTTTCRSDPWKSVNKYRFRHLQEQRQGNLIPSIRPQWRPAKSTTYCLHAFILGDGQKGMRCDDGRDIAVAATALTRWQLRGNS